MEEDGHPAAALLVALHDHADHADRHLARHELVDHVEVARLASLALGCALVLLACGDGDVGPQPLELYFERRPL
jgi:hypothetical protein